MTWSVRPVLERRELEQILALQRQNLATALSAEAMRAEGFVTAVHDLAALEGMHAALPSIVAKAGDTLAGYALSMAIESRSLVPILEPFFASLESLEWRDRPLAEQRFYVMGQICVAKEYRGRGVFDALYRGHAAHYGQRYDVLVTEVSMRNERSLRAHERVGFRPVRRHRDAVDDWLIIAWDLKASAPSEGASVARESSGAVSHTGSAAGASAAETNAAVAIARGWAAAVAASDVTRVTDLCAPDVAIVGPRGVARGRSVLAEWMERANASFETLRVFARGEQVVVEQRGRWHAPDGGITGEALVASRFRVAGGSIIEIERYDALPAALERAGLSVADVIGGPERG